MRKRYELLSVRRRRKSGSSNNSGGEGDNEVVATADTPDPLAPLLAALLTDRAEQVVEVGDDDSLDSRLLLAMKPFEVPKGSFWLDEAEVDASPFHSAASNTAVGERDAAGKDEGSAKESVPPSMMTAEQMDRLVMEVVRLLGEEFHSRGVLLGRGARAEHVLVSVKDNILSPRLGSHLGSAVVVDGSPPSAAKGGEGTPIPPTSRRCAAKGSSGASDTPSQSPLYVSSPMDAYPGRDLLHLFSTAKLDREGKVFTAAKTMLVCVALGGRGWKAHDEHSDPSPALVALAPFGVLEEMGRAGLLDGFMGAGKGKERPGPLSHWVDHASPVGGEDPVWAGGPDGEARLVRAAILVQQVASAGRGISLTGSSWARRDGVEAAAALCELMASRSVVVLRVMQRQAVVVEVQQRGEDGQRGESTTSSSPPIASLMAWLEERCLRPRHASITLRPAAKPAKARETGRGEGGELVGKEDLMTKEELLRLVFRPEASRARGSGRCGGRMRSALEVFAALEM